MNSKGFELSISTIVVLTISILVLIGLAYMVTNGFKSFKSGTKPFLDTGASSSIKQACVLACQNEDKLTYCCKKYELEKQTIMCNDTRLETACGTICESYTCA